MIRVAGWRSALCEYLRVSAKVPFHEDTQHCLHLVDGAILAQTGQRVFANILNAGDLKAQWRALRVQGHSDWPEVLSDFRAPAERLRLGDIAVFKGVDGRAAGGVVLGAEVRVYGVNGMANIGRSSAIYGLSLPCH